MVNARDLMTVDGVEFVWKDGIWRTGALGEEDAVRISVWESHYKPRYCFTSIRIGDVILSSTTETVGVPEAALGAVKRARQLAKSLRHAVRPKRRKRRAHGISARARQEARDRGWISGPEFVSVCGLDFEVQGKSRRMHPEIILREIRSGDWVAAFRGHSQESGRSEWEALRKLLVNNVKRLEALSALLTAAQVHSTYFPEEEQGPTGYVMGTFLDLQSGGVAVQYRDLHGNTHIISRDCWNLLTRSILPMGRVPLESARKIEEFLGGGGCH